MAIHRWWDSDSAERYWVEVTDREDLGADLIAPTTTHSGTETPSYTLVSHVEVGDVVLHWWKQTGQEPAFVGFSRAVAGVQDSTIDWQAHGTSGRTISKRIDHRPAWRVPLSDYEPFEDLITLTRLRAKEDQTRRLRDQLIEAHGAPIYFRSPSPKSARYEPRRDTSSNSPKGSSSCLSSPTPSVLQLREYAKISKKDPRRRGPRPPAGRTIPKSERL